MPRIVLRFEVEKELGNRGCKKLKDYVFGSGSLWQTRDGRFSFVVPQGIGGWSYEDDLRRVLQMIDSLN
jgi:hypothetical protein